ncbi:hypothetical protein D3C72_1579920 [compost metagenome]
MDKVKPDTSTILRSPASLEDNVALPPRVALSPASTPRNSSKPAAASAVLSKSRLAFVTAATLMGKAVMATLPAGTTPFKV